MFFRDIYYFLVAAASIPAIALLIRQSPSRRSCFSLLLLSALS